MEQTAPVGAGRQRVTRIVLDGVVDEVRLFPGALDTAAVAAAHARRGPVGPPPLEAGSLPKLPPGPAAFGAVYARPAPLRAVVEPR
jgi:hypothetical protein